MSDMETWHLTKAMLESGQIFEYPPNSPPKVDKHSTGAIGGKTSLILAPLLACDEVWVPMISGRGLDITGGTLDKLESIPGFNVNLDRTRAIKQLERIGVFMIGQTAEICPADKKLYALRDVTGTVPSRPLLVASIMCKKLAENLDRLVLNVRFGKGAFMKTRDKAKWLGEAMLLVGEGTGTQIAYLLTAMDEPLGRTVDNALELAEAIDCDFPKTSEGRLQRSGYPDLELIDHESHRVYYLDPKLYAIGSRDSSFHTFYFEPKIATNKVREDAVHFIVGFEHEKPAADRHWKFTRWDLVDLSHFQVKLKAEFQGSNHDMYRSEAIVATSVK